MTALKDVQLPVNDNVPDNVVALHCSLGSGQQWAELIEACGTRYNAVAPDIRGYGGNTPWLDPAPSTLEIEAEHVSEKLDALTGPIHLLGHSFGGAVAFKLATSGRHAHRVRSLTLIEPVLPLILLEQDTDRAMYELFIRECEYICSPIWSGEKELAVKRFLRYWHGAGYWERLSSHKKVAFLERANKLAGDFAAVFGEAGIGEAARRLTVPTLLFSGGASPLAMQQFVKRLASIMPQARHIHLPAADHLLPITYASEINPSILELIEVAHV
ncbi:alpha/beta fold hydrolase [Bradyrhizobium sp. SYSU BS000235]|uniref:alpha/beta fold hydrolase n=1 Tax=Bradyrhizobium sp. SYSU BS000235 TaxID=3411332 RepID=UPI003C734E07